MKCKSLFAVILVLCAALHAADKKKSSEPVVPQHIETLTLEKALELADTFQPQLAEAKALVDAADGRTKQAGSLPNPEAIVRGESLPLNGKGSGEYLVGVGQSIPINGSLGKGREVEALDRERLKSELETKRREVRQKVHSAFATALYQSKAYETFSTISAQADKAFEITKARVEAGDALPSDLARVEIEAARIQTEFRRTKLLREEALLHLANAIGNPAMHLDSLEGTLENTFEIPSIENASASLSEHPTAISADVEVKTQQARVDLAKAQRIPNVNVELLYRRDQNNKSDGVDIGLSIPLPIFNRGTGKIQEAKANLAAAEARSRARKNELALTLHETHAQLSLALDNSRTLKTEILPRAEKVLRVAEERYRSGDVALAEVLPIRREWAESQLTYLESVRDVMLAWADLSNFVAK